MATAPELVLAEASVRAPLPDFVIPSLPPPVPSEKAVETVAAEARLSVSVEFVAAPLETIPEPASEVRVAFWPLSSRVAPEATVAALPPSAPAEPIRRVPALTERALSVFAPESVSVPLPAFVSEPLVTEPERVCEPVTETVRVSLPRSTAPESVRSPLEVAVPRAKLPPTVTALARDFAEPLVLPSAPPLMVRVPLPRAVA